MKSLFLTVLAVGLCLCAQAKSFVNPSFIIKPIVISEDSLQHIEAMQFLNHTQVAIAKARKYEKAGNLAPSDNLSLAERLAAHAKTLLEDGQVLEAIKCSRKARELATQAITSYDNQEMADKYIIFPTEQTPFIQNTLSSDTTSLNYWIEALN